MILSLLYIMSAELSGETHWKNVSAGKGMSICNHSETVIECDEKMKIRIAHWFGPGIEQEFEIEPTSLKCLHLVEWMYWLYRVGTWSRWKWLTCCVEWSQGFRIQDFANCNSSGLMHFWWSDLAVECGATDKRELGIETVGIESLRDVYSTVW